MLLSYSRWQVSSRSHTHTQTIPSCIDVSHINCIKVKFFLLVQPSESVPRLFFVFIKNDSVPCTLQHIQVVFLLQFLIRHFSMILMHGLTMNFYIYFSSELESEQFFMCIFHKSGFTTQSSPICMLPSKYHKIKWIPSRTKKIIISKTVESYWPLILQLFHILLSKECAVTAIIDKSTDE